MIGQGWRCEEISNIRAPHLTSKVHELFTEFNIEEMRFQQPQISLERSEFVGRWRKFFFMEVNLTTYEAAYQSVGVLVSPSQFPRM